MAEQQPQPQGTEYTLQGEFVPDAIARELPPKTLSELL